MVIEERSDLGVSCGVPEFKERALSDQLLIQTHKTGLLALGLTYTQAKFYPGSFPRKLGNGELHVPPKAECLAFGPGL